MQNKPENPSAFPLRSEETEQMSYVLNDGMKLRDYFAAAAMQAIFAGEGARTVADRDKRYDETNWKEVVAANAYEMADAMLIARSE